MNGDPIIQVVADGNPGGGTTAVLGLCEDLRKRLDRQIILVTQSDSYAFSQGNAIGLTVRGLDFFRSRMDFRLARRLNDLIHAEGPALVHAHGGRAAYPIAAASRTFPLVYTVHGYHFPAKNPFVRPIFRYAEVRSARTVDHMIFVSEADKRIAERNGLISGLTRFSIIRNGIDPSRLGSHDQIDRSDSIIFLGRMHRQKNPLLAVRMMAYLRDLPVKLVMVGGGELSRDVRDLVAQLKLDGAVEMLGPLAWEAALVHLRRARLMVFPSSWEGLPIAPMEALYFGVPVVASAIPGTDEVVSNGRNGLLVDKPTPEAMAVAVRRLITDQAEWTRLSMNGKVDAIAQFDRGLNSSAHIDLYAKLIGQPPRT